MTPKEGLEEKIFDMHMAGFDDAYTYVNNIATSVSGEKDEAATENH
ncbi:hypothetical protein [Anaerocolumna sedimenticola]|nr:hypothetical protein [Anaerocolumna sedimenticola]